MLVGLMQHFKSFAFWLDIINCSFKPNLVLMVFTCIKVVF